MHHRSASITRRHLLRLASGLASGAAVVAAPWVHAQPGLSAAPSRNAVTIAQIVDSSLMQQDVSKDFLIGSRAAWQDINSRGGLRGRPVQHVSLETDGSTASLRQALAAATDNPSCIVLSGSAGDPVASQLVTGLQQDHVAIAHVAPWLQSAAGTADDRTFPIFAARREQIGHALKSLLAMGVQEMGVVYASMQDQALYRADIEPIAAGMKLKLQSFRPTSDLKALGQSLNAATPAILLFVGGTPELVQLTQGLEKQARQRYVVALADVDLQTLVQMGGARGIPVIATQAVPMVNAGLPVVQAYRAVLARLFDEPPAALSLAGFIAARYTFEVLNDVDGPLSRQTALVAFQRRNPVDVGGFRVSFDSQRRSAGYVTQSMLAQDGRLIG